ncbi:unnamed protein product, partial [Adineta ricciae]
MLHDSSDEDEGGGGAVNKKVVNNPPVNRPVAALNRPTANHVNTGSPVLTSRSEHSSPTSKTTPTHFSPQANFHAPSTPTQRTLPKIPTSANNSPSASLRSSTNTNLFPETQNSSMLFNTDTTSIKSDDSSTFSEGHLHPSQQQSSLTKTRSPQPTTTAATNQNTSNLSKTLATTASSSTGTTASSTGIPVDRAPSPSPSLISEREREENERVERELELKRKRLQVYVFICRCVACPFNSKQSSDMARKHLKITLVQYGVIKERFLAFLN